MTADEELPLEVVFELLKNRRRRLVLRYLHENPGPVDTDTLSVHIAAVENEKSEAAVSAAERKRVYVALYQWHLQKLADAGVIETDRKVNVELGPNAAQVYERLETVDAAGKPHTARYVAAAVFAGGAVGFAFPMHIVGAKESIVHLAVAVTILAFLVAAVLDTEVWRRTTSDR